MSSRDGLNGAGRPAFDDCWNRIGVRGDSSCPELRHHVHCRNCPVYSAAAVSLLDTELPEGHLSEWTGHIAREQLAAPADTQSVVLFRIGAEWLALPTAMFKEIADLRSIHSIPHRRNGVVLGLVNVRGELLVCLSLRQLLGVQAQAAPRRERQRIQEERLLVIESEGSRCACPVDEVHGIVRFAAGELGEVPATIAKAAATYVKAVLPWQDKAVGLLDQALLFHTFNRSLSSATAT